MKNFFKTVMIVTIFSVCEKFLGFLYRVFLSRTIGSEGMGLYQVALSVFALLLTISCSGTPITVSRLMTKYRAEGRKDKINKVITAGFLVTLLFAVPLCLLFFVFGNKLAFLFADERCVKIFLIVLPGLIFTSVYAVLRGVFWGNKDFLPYSVLELLEEICMIIVGVVLITRVTSIYQGAIYAGVAVVISYIFSFSLAVIVFFLRKNKLANPREELKPLLASAMPITAMRTANSFISSLVSIILPIRLISAGYTASEAMSAYGSALGQAMPILSIPATLTGSFTLVLIPALSENYYAKKHTALKKDMEKAIKFTIFISSLFVPLFLVCGKEIGVLIYGNIESGKFLTASSYLMILMGTSNVSTSMLNSMGMENRTLIYFIIGMGLMLLSVWLLPPVLGIYSLLVGFTCVYGVTTILNLYTINKICEEKPRCYAFILLSLMFLLPTCILGIMLENLLLPFLGTFLTFLSVSIVLVIFNALLYLVFGLISLDRIKLKLKKKPQPV